MAELITKKEHALGWVTFSNPTKLNAVSHEMWKALPGALAAFDADPEVRAIVIAGEGEKAFISGADISQFEKARSSAEAQAAYNSAVSDAFAAPGTCTKPVIARIRGICIGGGLGLAAACDLRFAADDAVFQMPAARLGLGYGVAGLERFVQILGQANAADIFFSARKFGADEAMRMGFLNRVVPAADLDRELAAYCALLAQNAPLTIAAAKFTIRQSGAGERRDLAKARKMIEACFASADYTKGAPLSWKSGSPCSRGASRLPECADSPGGGNAMKRIPHPRRHAGMRLARVPPRPRRGHSGHGSLTA
jgi:enoyl-CoA hydratase/carnithine racemase